MTTTPEPAAPTLLHLFLLTYNREKAFRRTLEAIAASPLKDCPLTVMDNCSTDGTPGVCEEFRPLLPHMEVCRHQRNIGFGANYLRSIELSRGEYTWILCDDDTLFPDRMGSLLAMLRDHRPQACFVGGPRQENWPAGEALSPRELQRQTHTFTTVPSFVPCLVFKTSLVGSAELLAGYFAIRTNFPQMVLGRKLFVDDIPCAVLKPPLIHREEPEEKGIGYLDVVDGWSTSCRLLPPEWCEEAFYSFFGRPDMVGMIRETLRMIVWAKVEGGGKPGYHLARIGLNMGFAVRLALLPCRLACMVPGPVYNMARESYRKVKYGWLRRPLPPNYHAPLCRDELRR
jgi:glycosyltransferase involved in cell wall biosynthesis